MKKKKCLEIAQDIMDYYYEYKEEKGTDDGFDYVISFKTLSSKSTNINPENISDMRTAYKRVIQVREVLKKIWEEKKYEDEIIDFNLFHYEDGIMLKLVSYNHLDCYLDLY